MSEKTPQDFSQEAYNLQQKPLNLKSLKKANVLLESYNNPTNGKQTFTHSGVLPSIQTSKVNSYGTKVSSRYFSHAFFK
jgi:hypothetical protein